MTAMAQGTVGKQLRYEDLIGPVETRYRQNNLEK